MADEFDDAFHRLDQQRALTALSVTRPAPDAIGKANALARQTGVPPETADRNLSTLEQQVQLARARAVMQSSPIIASWASNPRNAAVGADDMEQLAKNARHWQEVGRLSGSITATPSPEANPLTYFAGLGRSVYETGVQIVTGIRRAASDWAPHISLPTAPGVPKLGNHDSANLDADYARSVARADAARPEFKSALGKRFYQTSETVAQALPVIAATVLTGGAGGVALGAAAASVQSGAPAYSKYRARGGTRGEAAAGALLEGGAEAAGEAIPLGFLVNKFGKAGTKGLIAGMLLRELPSESATTLAQNAVDTAIANPDKTWGQYWADQPEALVQTALGTLALGGIVGGASHLAARYAKEGQEHVQATAEATALDQAMRGAAESKTRARDPEGYAQLVGMHTTGTPIENMFIPAAIADAYFAPADWIR